jgi:hypothetical protein
MICLPLLDASALALKRVGEKIQRTIEIVQIEIVQREQVAKRAILAIMSLHAS